MATGVVKTFEGSFNRYVSNWGDMTLKMSLKMTQTYDLGTGKSSLRFSDFQMGYFCPNNIGNFGSYINGSIKVTVNGTTYTIFEDSDGAGSAPSYRCNFTKDTFDIVTFSSGANNGSAWYYELNDLAHAADGSLSVSVEWTDITAYTYMQGANLKISGSDTVDLTANPLSFALSVSAGTGSVVTVNRISSVSGLTGTIVGGAVLYVGDVLEITFAAETGYDLDTHTVNGTPFTSGSTHTVAAAVTVVSSALVKSFVLTISADAKSTVTVTRTDSPLKSAATGELSSGSEIYYNDVLQIVTAIAAGYSAKEQTINGSAFASGDSHTVTADVIIVVVTESSGTANIGGALYQIGIAKDGVINLYVAGVAKDGAFHILS